MPLKAGAVFVIKVRPQATGQAPHALSVKGSTTVRRALWLALPRPPVGAPGTVGTVPVSANTDMVGRTAPAHVLRPTSPPPVSHPPALVTELVIPQPSPAHVTPLMSLGTLLEPPVILAVPLVPFCRIVDPNLSSRVCPQSTTVLFMGV